MSFEPVPLILTAIEVPESSFPVEVVILPIPLVLITVFHSIDPEAFPDPFAVLAFVGTPVFPSLFAMSVRLILLPLSFILLSLLIDKYSISVSLIIEPLSFIVASVFMGKFSVPPCCVLLPVALVNRPIRPKLAPYSLSHIFFDISVVYGLVAEFDDLSLVLTGLLVGSVRGV